MALSPGASIDPATALSACIDLVFANRSSALVARDLVITVLEPTVLMAHWPSVDHGGNLIYLRFSARPVKPESIVV